MHLVGGGWAEADRETVYGPFLDEAGADPVVACVVLDEGDGAEQAERWASVLRATRPCRPRPVLVPEGGTLDPAALDGADALLVCGGLTPAYADALAPAAARSGGGARPRPYLGFSAGAAAAPGRALVGGWRLDGRAVCPEDAGEDLDGLRVDDGLGLVPFAVDVHADRWGTLGRLVAAVGAGLVGSGVALDEGTVLRVAARARRRVRGSGAAHLVLPVDGGAVVRALVAGTELPLEALVTGTGRDLTGARPTGLPRRAGRRRRSDEAGGVDGLAVDADLEVQVAAGRQAGRADVADDLALADRPALDDELLQVRVGRGQRAAGAGRAGPR